MNPFHHALLDSGVNFYNGTYYQSSAKISEYKPLDPFATFGCGRNPVDGYYYFAAMSTGGAPLNRSHYVFKYDIQNNNIIEEAHIPKSQNITSSYDVHPIPTINFDSNGHIYVSMEKTKNSTGWSDGHETDILIYKTGTAGDLSTMQLWKTIPGYFAYLKLFIKSTNYYLIARGRRISQDSKYLSVQKSTDSGLNFTEHVILNFTDATYPTAPYTNTIQNFDNDDLCIIINPRDSNYNSLFNVSFMRSVDGVTWQNAENTFSKNVSSNGTISFTEAESNFVIWSVDPNLYQVTYEGGCLKNGIIKVLAAKSNLTGVVVDGNEKTSYVELRLYTFENGTWSYIDLSEILITDYEHFWAYERTMQYVPSLTEDCIFVLDRRDTADVKLRKYVSTDNFQTHTVEVVFEGSGNIYFGSNTFNSESLEEQIIILNDVQGEYDDFNDSSNLIIVKPE